MIWPPDEVVQEAAEALGSWLVRSDDNNIDNGAKAVLSIPSLRRLAEKNEPCDHSTYDNPDPPEYQRCVYHKGHRGPHWANGQKWMAIDPEPGSDSERELTERAETAERRVKELEEYISTLKKMGLFAQAEQQADTYREALDWCKGYAVEIERSVPEGDGRQCARNIQELVTRTLEKEQG